MNKIITVAEARRLIGEKAQKMSDQEVADLSDQLDWLAQLAIQSYRNEIKNRRRKSST